MIKNLPLLYQHCHNLLVDRHDQIQTVITQDVLVKKEAESVPSFGDVAGRWISDFGTLKFGSTVKPMK